MKWIKLTGPDGEPLWISTKQIVLVEAYKMEGQPAVNTAIHMTSGVRRYVNETVDEVGKRT